MSRSPRTPDAQPSCGSCFFGRNNLCALELDSACATYRPDSPEGLRPARQLRFAFRVSDAEPQAPVAPARPARRNAPRERPEQPMLASSFGA